MKWLLPLLVAFPLPAAALSCLPWPLELAYQEASESQAAYVVVSGTLAFDPELAPVTDWDN